MGKRERERERERGREREREREGGRRRVNKDIRVNVNSVVQDCIQMYNTITEGEIFFEGIHRILRGEKG